MNKIELYIFNQDLEFKGILDMVFSLRWVRRYNKVGEFELQCPLTSESLNLLERDNIIYKKDDTEAGYIEYRNLRKDAEGKEVLIIKGRFLTGYFDRRIIWGQENFKGTFEVAMRTLVDKHCINPFNKDRKIDSLILGKMNNFSGNANKQVSYKNLEEELENLSNTSNLGYRINLDIANKKLVFDIYKGADRSINQSSNPKCIFSKEFDNILKQEYIDSLNNYKNVTLIAGAGEGNSRKLTSVGYAKGVNRFELFTDAKDIADIERVEVTDSEGVTTTEDKDIPWELYELLLRQRGNEKLAECKELETFDSEFNANSNLKYKIDFDLGDIVTSVNRPWNLTIDSRITEIEEVYEENGLSINIILGNNIPTLLDKIKQKIN